MTKARCWFQYKTRIEAEKNKDEDGKALYKPMNNAVYEKTTEKLRNRIDVTLVSNKKGRVKWASKPQYMSHKIFENNLVVIHKNKVPWTLNKPAYIGMCLLELSKALMYEFHYDYI